MTTQERDRIIKEYYGPDINAVTCVAKCTAGIAIIGLIGVIGLSSSLESTPTNIAHSAYASAGEAQAAGTPRQNEAMRDAQGMQSGTRADSGNNVVTARRRQ